MADPIVPYPIEVQLTGSKIANVTVTVKNNTTGDTQTLVTNSTGYGFVDAANFTNGYTNGDSITASAINYSADFKWEVIDDSTGQQIRKETATAGTGTLSDLTKFFSTNKLRVIVTETTENGNYELHILYEG